MFPPVWSAGFPTEVFGQSSWDGSSAGRLSCPSAPRFPLGSASSQTVCPLPGALHQLQSLPTALLHQRIKHVFMEKVHLWTHHNHEASHTLSEHVSSLHPLTWKMAFHALSNDSRRRPLSSQPLKYRTHGGRNCVRSAANSYQQNSREAEPMREVLKDKSPFVLEELTGLSWAAYKRWNQTTAGVKGPIPGMGKLFTCGTPKVPHVDATERPDLKQSV